MNLENLKSTNLVWQRNFDLTIQTSGTQQSRVKSIRSIGGHDDLGLAEVVKTIELVQKLHECSLNFSVGAGTLGEAASTDGIDFVHEDDAGFVFLCVAKHFSDQTRGLADILVHDG